MIYLDFALFVGCVYFVNHYLLYSENVRTLSNNVQQSIEQSQSYWTT